MKDSIKRLFITAVIIALSVATALLIDVILDKKERETYSLGEEQSVYETVEKYSKQYGIPQEMIYTVMKMRSNCTRFYESDGRYGYMGLNMDDVKIIKDSYEVAITEDMLRNPSYNLLFGVQIISKLYSSLEDKNAVYAALLYGSENASDWLESSKYTDITGSLVSVPEGVGNEFYEYLKTEQKYVELYFGDN